MRLGCRVVPFSKRHPAVRAVILAALAGTLLQADLVKLQGDAVDYDFAPEKYVCCIDVASTNLLIYLRNHGYPNIPGGGKTAFEQQKDFHALWDPTLTKHEGGAADAKKALEAALDEDKSTYDFAVTMFSLDQLSYDALLKEWSSGELILLFMDELDRGWGHSMFLWGVDTDPGNPRLSVVDPLVHPNIDQHMSDGKVADSKGGETTAVLSIGKESNNLPDWNISYETPEYTYTVDGDEYTFPQRQFRYRVRSFVSVSRVPEPSSMILLSLAVVVIAITCVRACARTRP